MEKLTKTVTTKKDLDHFSNTVLGFSFKELSTNLDEIKSGQLEKTSELIEEPQRSIK